MKNTVKFIAVVLETLGILSYVTILISFLWGIAGNDILTRIFWSTILFIGGVVLTIYENNIEKKNSTQLNQAVDNKKIGLSLKFFLIALTISIIMLIMFFIAASQIHFSDV